MGYG
jgi:hypothetical protein